MGNKSSTNLVTIHEDLLSRKKNKNSADKSDDHAIELLDGIAECVESCSGDVVKLSSKDTKLLASIASLLCDEFGSVIPANCATAEISMRRKYVAIIYRLLQIPIVAKSALESCVTGLVNCLDPSHIQLLSLSASCICAGLVAVNDDTLKGSVCMHLNALNFHGKMLDLFDIAAKSRSDVIIEDKRFLFQAILMYAQHLVWLIGQNVLSSSLAIAISFKALKKGLVTEILQRQDSLYELTRHTDRPVQFAATMLIIQVMNYLGRRYCSNMQETARNKGLLLWTMQRVAEQSLAVVRSSSSTRTRDNSSASNSTNGEVSSVGSNLVSSNRSAWSHAPPIEGVVLAVCESEVVTAEGCLDSARVLLTLLCLGDKANEAAVFKALPESFSSFLSLRPSHDVTTTDDDAPTPLKMAIKNESTTGFFRPFSRAPSLKNMIKYGSSGNLTPLPASGEHPVPSLPLPTVAPEGPVLVDSRTATSVLLIDGGHGLRVSYAAKMGVHEKGSWHVLFAVLCESFESPKMVWNELTLEHLAVSLKDASDVLDKQRAVSFDPWDARSLDVVYPLYSSRKYLCVRGVFLPQLIAELEVGRSFFLDDPHGTLWAILDRATVEVEAVFSRLMRFNQAGSNNSEECDTHFMTELSVCLQAVSLLMARYHPELHRVTPMHGLCSLLKKGVLAVRHIFDNSERLFSAGEKRRVVELLQWLNSVLSIFQSRLSGPISRDDWPDFVTAGGAGALCDVLMYPFPAVSSKEGNGDCDGEKYTGPGSDAALKVDELLMLSAQLLQRLVVSGTKYAMAFSSTLGLDQLSVAIWQLSRRIKETSHLTLNGIVTSRDPTLSPPSRRDSVGEAGVDLAFSSLVNVTQRVLDASRGSFFGIISAEECSAAPILADKYLSLVRVLVAAAIHPRSTSPTLQSEGGVGSTGSLSVSSARLLKDILVRFDSIQSAVTRYQHITPTSSSSVDELENMRVTLHAAIPENLLILCRLLDPSNFAQLFNSQSMTYLPEIIWCSSLRWKCLESLQEDLQQWKHREQRLEGTFPPPPVAVNEEFSVIMSENPTTVTSIRFPSLTSEPKVMSLYLRCYLLSHPDDFLVPLSSREFAIALYSEAVTVMDGLNIENKFSVSLSNSKYVCLLYLCVSHLIQLWPQGVSSELWCQELAPSLLSCIETCTSQLFLKAPVSPSLPALELFQTCTSCISCVASYLKVNTAFPTTLDVRRKTDSHGSTETEKNIHCVTTIGSSYAELLKAIGPMLGNLIYRCVGVLLSREIDTTGESPQTAAFHASNVVALEASTALLASLSLLLGEEAHIERVRLREFSGRRDVTSTSASSSGPVSVPIAVTSKSMTLKFPTQLSGRFDIKSDAAVTHPPTPPSPATPSLLRETARRLDIARQALRAENHKLLASLVSCCQDEVARSAPKATLSAISALHLLVGMECDDEEWHACSSIFPTPPVSSLVEILSQIGLPEMLLELALLQLQTDDPLSPPASPTQGSSFSHDTTQSVANDGPCRVAQLSRWATHPLFTTDRFILSTLPPVQFLPSPRAQIGPTEQSNVKAADTSTPLESLPKVLHHIIDGAERVEKAYYSERDHTANAFNSEEECAYPGRMGRTVARECIELLRLMAICPISSAMRGVSRSLGGSPASSSFTLKNDSVAFPVGIFDIDVSRLNQPLGHSLEMLLTAPMVFVMMTEPTLFLQSLCTFEAIERPLMLWGPSMKERLASVLRSENKQTIFTLSKFFAVESDGVGQGSKVQRLNESAEGDTSDTCSEKNGPIVASRSALHGHLSSECLVDNVYIRFLAPVANSSPDGQSLVSRKRREDGRDDIGVRDLARFLENLQASISSSKLVIDHVIKTSNSSQLLVLKSQLALKESVLTQMLADHDELGYGYSDLYLDS